MKKQKLANESALNIPIDRLKLKDSSESGSKSGAADVALQDALPRFLQALDS